MVPYVVLIGAVLKELKADGSLIAINVVLMANNSPDDDTNKNNERNICFFVFYFKI